MYILEPKGRNPIKQWMLEEMPRLCLKVKEQGGRLISAEYLGSRTPHEFECGQGHRFWNSPTNIIRGQWCPHCKGLAPKTIEELQQFAASLGWELHSQVYVNNRTNLTWECDRGHVFEARWANIQSRKSCPVCHKKKPYGIDEMKRIAREHEGECLS